MENARCWGSIGRCCGVGAGLHVHAAVDLDDLAGDVG